ncbi:MAG: FixH family protein [Caulobacter sp.]|nr:FixH family protein [Caulobacter sp.]
MTQMTATQGFTIKGWHVLVGFVLFFGVIIAVDVAFAMAAYRTFSGEAIHDPYEAGILYNNTLAQRRREASLGWKATIEEQGQVVVVRVADRNGEAIQGLTVTGVLVRPATVKGQKTLAFAADGKGGYRADTASLDGAWDLHVVAKDTAGAVFEADRRMVRP